MKKEGVVLLFLAIFISVIDFVSSQGLSDVLNQINESTVILFGIFLVCFALLFFALNRALKGNTAIAAVISAVVSFLIVYAVNRTGIDFNSFFYGIGISPDSLFLSTIIPLIILGISVFLIIKMKKNSLLILGGAFIVFSFFVYAQTLLIIVGAVLIIVRFLIPKGKWEVPPKRRGGGGYYSGGGI